MNDQQMSGGYKIGAVSRMTGIAPETIRMWERRYALINPSRGETRTRLYTDADVRHLTLLKKLVAEGHAISSLASLTEAELEQRLQTHLELRRAVPGTADCDTVSVCVLGSTLPILLKSRQSQSNRLHFTGLYTGPAEFEEAVRNVRPDVLILEYQSLTNDDLKQIRDRFRYSNAKRVIVIYTFTNSATLRKLASRSIQTMQGPLDFATLERLCATDLEPAPAGPNDPGGATEIPRKFSDAQISKIATIQTDVGCECPHHVALILAKLTAFEAYSQDCEDSNDEDAALHAHLRRITMQARATFEAALPDILESDGIDIDDL